MKKEYRKSEDVSSISRQNLRILIVVDSSKTKRNCTQKADKTDCVYIRNATIYTGTNSNNVKYASGRNNFATRAEELMRKN